MDDKHRASVSQSPPLFARGASPVSPQGMLSVSPVDILSMPLLTPVEPTVGSIPLANTPRFPLLQFTRHCKTGEAAAIGSGESHRRLSARPQTAKVWRPQPEHASAPHRSDSLFFTGELGPSREVAGVPCPPSHFLRKIALCTNTDKASH
jgi:hypothetical protein